MSLITASGIAAQTCLRIEDNEEFELKFLRKITGHRDDYREFTHFTLKAKDEELLERYFVPIIGQSSGTKEILGSTVIWENEGSFRGKTVVTFYYNPSNRRLKNYMSTFCEDCSPLFKYEPMDEWLCLKNSD